jgi:hypothetical protein
MRIARKVVIGLMLFGCLWANRQSAGQAISFTERFALASDRAAILKQLIPGTEDYYYYHCLHYQNQQQHAEVEKLLPVWASRHGETPRYHEIVTRHYLHVYPANHSRSLDWLKTRLTLTFDHQRPPIGEKPNLPEKLDPALISRNTLTTRAMERHPNLEGFETTALDWLTAHPLNVERRRNLLERLTWPDYTNLAKLVADDLNAEHSGGFGSLGIHRLMLLSQLDELLKLKPDIRDNATFVQVYLSKLVPTRDEDANVDPVVREALLSRQWAFASTLAPAHNSIKAHILYHRLVHDRALGKWNEARFLAYLALPRPVAYINPKFMESPERQSTASDLNLDASGYTGFRPIGNDEPLVRSYLMHFLVEREDTKVFEPFIESTYLQHVYAEIKLLAGLGNAEKWYSLLRPEQVQALKDRVDLEFAHENKSLFAVADRVVIDVDVKNVQKLLVKVFEIRTGQFYRTLGREIDTDISLDGLVAHEEKSYSYDVPPLRRERRRFEFDTITKPGVYVVDFIGNGKSSRVLVRKGRLHPLVAPHPLGLQVLVLNEQRQHVKDASLWFSGVTYKADDKGIIQIPFTADAGLKSVVLSHGDFSSLAQLNIPGESYSLNAAMHIDRESLRARKPATLIIRPQLLAGGYPVSPALLENAKLTISSTTLDGIANNKEVKELKLSETKEYTYELQTPARLAKMTVQLDANVKGFLNNQPIPLSASQSFDLNLIDRSSAVDDFHLLKTDQGYILECCGKTGELRPQIPYQLTLKHRDFRQTVVVPLKTNDLGRTELGDLSDISYISVPTRGAGEGSPSEITWFLLQDARRASEVLHARQGDEIRIPYLGAAETVSRSEFSLVQSAGSGFVSQHFETLSLDSGYLVVKKLPAGDYDLRIKSTAERFTIRVSAGDEKFGIVLGKVRQLQTRGDVAPHMVSIKPSEKAIVATVANANEKTRVHVFATRFAPAFRPFSNLSKISMPGLGIYYSPRWDSAFVSGRKIGDEFQYILDRRQTKKYAGNMLERPSLLLNPWSIRKTQADLEKLAGGADFDAAGVPYAVPAEPGGEGGEGSAAGISPHPGDFSNLDFLADSPLVVANLPVEKDGTVTIDRAALGQKQWLHFILADAESTEYRQLALQEAKTTILDLRLAKAFPEAEIHTQQRKTTLLGPGDTLEIADLSTTKTETFDNLRSAYRLLRTLSGGKTTLSEFAFLLDWPNLKPEEKREKYSQFACHELHFFLMRKDPEFFASVVKPYLANKKDKTFLDLYLLDADLSNFVKPWNYARLNSLERILLAQRIDSELASVRMLLRDQVENIPLNVALDDQRYTTALLLGSMGDRTAFFMELESAAIPFGDETPARVMSINGLSFDKRLSVEPAVNDQPKSGESEGKREELANEDDEKAKSHLGLADRLFDADGEAKLGALEKLRKKASGIDAEQAELRSKMQRLDDVESHFSRGYAIPAAGKRFVRPFQALPETEEWAENNYYKLRIADQLAGLVPPNRFWRDFVNHDGKSPFLSPHLTDATSSFTEMMLALAVLDLPFESAKHEEKIDGVKYSLRAASPMMILHEGIFPTAKKSESATILLSQNLFRADDRHKMVEGVQVDKFVSEEFLVHTVYGCQVVVTNPTSANQQFDLLVQIPQGALPVSGGHVTRSLPIALGPYATQRVEYFFYFPAPGESPHYGAKASSEGVLLAGAPHKVLNVVKELTSFDRESWDYVSLYGSDEEVFAFLKTKNLQQIDLSRIAYRMKNAKFFGETVALLASRHSYDAVLWSYSIFHDAPEIIREYLRTQDAIVNQAGASIDSPLLVIDPIERRTYEHLDYRPLINPRAHQLGPQRTILNDAFRAQYERLMSVLTYRRNLSDAEKLAVIYYLLLQDRIEESLDLFSQVDSAKLVEKLQFDYFAAYLKMSLGSPEEAKQIAAKYNEYPVDRWRKAFAAIVQQVDEVGGASSKVVDDQSREQIQAELAAREPSFDFTVEAKKIQVKHQNLSDLTVHYYLMDLELLFSNNPFVQSDSGQFSFVRPNLTKVVKLDKSSGETTLDLPDEFHQSNVLIEIEAGGKNRTKTHFANAMTVQMLNNYGQVRVNSADQKPIAGAYVKVYARHGDGSVKFHKDGYTDLRGRFDYASVSGPEAAGAVDFSMLILSEKHGAVIREAKPPRQ